MELYLPVAEKNGMTLPISREANKRIRLYCLPYAGGNASIFQAWKRDLDHRVELYPVGLAGRGSRLGEALSASIQEAAQDAFSGLRSEFDRFEYALFGHSMGALIAFELARIISHSNVKQPAHIFFSGREAPHISANGSPKYHLMPEDEFREEILKMGGTPPEIFQNRQLRELFVPILRNDFRITENYALGAGDVRFDNPISVLVGEDEDYSREEITGWRGYSSAACDIRSFKGGHFFIKDSEKLVLESINSTLRNYL